MTTQLYIEKLKLKDIANTLGIKPCMLPNLYDDYDRMKANDYFEFIRLSIVC